MTPAAFFDAETARLNFSEDWPFHKTSGHPCNLRQFLTRYVNFSYLRLKLWSTKVQQTKEMIDGITNSSGNLESSQMYQGPALQSLEDHNRENAQFTHSLDLSNFALPPRDQFEAFRFTYRGVMDVSVAPDGLQSFPARQTVWDLDRLAFMRTRLPGARHTHRQKHLKTCLLDHWYVSLPFRSPKFGEWHEAEIAVPELHCLATPFDREINHDGILTLFIPHNLFASTAGLHRMLDVKLEGGLGKLLADYLFLLDRSLADLQSAEIPYIVEATRSLVAVCLAPSPDRLMEAQTPVDATLLGRARRIIDGRLADRNLTSGSLCTALGVSRSRLYRIFEPLGGVASYIRKQRLLRTRDALSDIADTRSISRIAEQWGFIDASAYSRTFRHEFGISPKEARDIGWASDGFVVAQQCQVRYDGAQSLYQLLRTVDGIRSGLSSAAPAPPRLKVTPHDSPRRATTLPAASASLCSPSWTE